MIEIVISFLLGAAAATGLVRAYWPRIIEKPHIIEKIEERLIVEKEEVDPRLTKKFAVVFQTDSGARARDAIVAASPKENESFEFFEGSVRRQLKGS